MVLTNSFSDVPSKLGSCFYVFQTMFLNVHFLHPTENLIQCLFQQAAMLFFGSCCFCIISKHSYVLNNFRKYFYAKAFQNVNVHVKYAIHSNLVICNNFVNYKVLPAFDFHSIGLEPSQLLQTDLIPERKCCKDYCFRLVFFILPIMFARVFLRNTHKRVKAFFGCMIFLLTTTKPNFFTKNDILNSISEIFTYESIDACNLLHKSHIHNAFVFFALAKFKGNPNSRGILN